MGQCSNDDDHHTFIYLQLKNYTLILEQRYDSIDMDILRNKKHATNRNWHWALDQYVSPKNNIKCCQKYMKVVEYWHETIKKL